MRNTIFSQFITRNFGLNLIVKNDIHQKINRRKVSYRNDKFVKSTYFSEPV